MSDFSTKILVESIEEYMMCKKHIKNAGYSPPIFNKQKKAEKKMWEQIKLYKAQKKQVELKLKSNPNNQQ